MCIVVRGCRVRVRGCRSLDLCAVRYVQGKFLSGINVGEREGEREVLQRLTRGQRLRVNYD